MHTLSIIFWYGIFILASLYPSGAASQSGGAVGAPFWSQHESYGTSAYGGNLAQEFLSDLGHTFPIVTPRSTDEHGKQFLIQRFSHRFMRHNASRNMHENPNVALSLRNRAHMLHCASDSLYVPYRWTRSLIYMFLESLLCWSNLLLHDNAYFCNAYWFY